MDESGTEQSRWVIAQLDERQLEEAQAVIAMGRTCLWRLREERRAIVDAHGEDAVPAYLNRCIKHLGDFAKQPADTAALDAAIAAAVKPYNDGWLDQAARDSAEIVRLECEIERLAAATKPLVDALFEIGQDAVRQGDAIWMRDVAKAALAQLKGGP